jgi:hypothetical protein
MKLEFSTVRWCGSKDGTPLNLGYAPRNLQLAGRSDIDWSKLWLKTLEQEQNPLDPGRCLNLIGLIKMGVQKREKI